MQLRKKRTEKQVLSSILYSLLMTHELQVKKREATDDREAKQDDEREERRDEGKNSPYQRRQARVCP
jgi:hypothetical protein